MSNAIIFILGLATGVVTGVLLMVYLISNDED